MTWKELLEWSFHDKQEAYESFLRQQTAMHNAAHQQHLGR